VNVRRKLSREVDGPVRTRQIARAVKDKGELFRRSEMGTCAKLSSRSQAEALMTASSDRRGSNE
jgi:hypothetical protein